MNNPFYYAVVWRGGNGQIVGQIVDLHEYQSMLKQGYSLHSFTGRKATVCIVSLDVTITRAQRLDFATMFMRGSYVTISVDLKNLTSTTANGSPPP